MTKTTDPMDAGREPEEQAGRNGAADGEQPPETAEATESGVSTDGAGLEEEVERLRSQYQRALADYQNLERRSREERLEVGQFAVAEVVRGFLPVLDDLERAMEAVDAEQADTPWAEGVRLVMQKFKSSLQQHGVEEIHALGQPFDPSKHEAVGSAPGPDGQVVQLLQRGYALRDRVVRPAMVMVGNGEGGTPASTGADGQHDAGDDETDEAN